VKEKRKRNLSSTAFYPKLVTSSGVTSETELMEGTKRVEQLDDKVRIMSGQTDAQKSNLSQPGNRRK
jgi:hypothetical protein